MVFAGVAVGLEVGVAVGNAPGVEVMVGADVNVGAMTAVAAPAVGVPGGWICSGIFAEQAASDRKRGMMSFRICTCKL